MTDTPLDGTKQERMRGIRGEIDQDLEDVSASAHNMVDWKHYVKTYPWVCLGAAAAVGFLIAPKRPTVNTAAANSTEPTPSGTAVGDPAPATGRGLIGVVLADKKEESVRTACRYRDIFGHHFYNDLQNNLNLEGRQLCRNLVELADSLGIGYVATNNVHYARREGHRLQDVLVCIRNRSTLDTSHHLRRPNSEYHLKSADEMSRLFREYPEALANTLLIAEACELDLDLSNHRFPDFPVPRGETADSYLEKLTAVAQDAHVDVREFILGATLGASGQNGFLAALRQYLQRFSAQYGLRTELVEPIDWNDELLGPTVWA